MEQQLTSLTHATSSNQQTRTASEENLEQQLTELLQTSEPSQQSRRNAARTLINVIREQNETLNDGGQYSKQAFNNAEQTYANHILSNISVDANQAWHPQVIQTNHALGTYSLDVKQYTPRTIVPKIFEQGIWVAHPEHSFQVEIISDINASAGQILLNTLKKWKKIYHESTPASFSSPEISSAIEIVIKQLIMELEVPVPESFSINLYFVVRLNGSSEPISILSARVSQNRIFIRESLSAPQNILAPYAEGTVRGAGTAAAARLVEYAREMNIPRIMSFVISQPSATVKKKLGFRSLDEL